MASPAYDIILEKYLTCHAMHASKKGNEDADTQCSGKLDRMLGNLSSTVDEPDPSVKAQRLWRHMPKGFLF